MRVRPASRLGQAYLSPSGNLYVVVSDPWPHPWRADDDWRHDMVVFPAEDVFHRGEDTVAELERRTGWTRLA